MANTTLWIQAKPGDTPLQYTGFMDRKVLNAIYPIEGVLGTGQLKVTERAAGANMSVDVAGGGAVVKCDTVVNGGSYLTFEDATVNLTIPAAPSSGSRTHKIYEKIADPQSDGGTSYTSGPFVSIDAGSGAPDVLSAYLLATVTVTHGDASVRNAGITDMRNQASGPPAYDRGTKSDQLSPAGRVIVDHDLGVSPAEIVFGGGANGRYLLNVIARDASTFTVECTNPQTGNTGASGQNVSFSWVAYR